MRNKGWRYCKEHHKEKIYFWRYAGKRTEIYRPYSNDWVDPKRSKNIMKTRGRLRMWWGKDEYKESHFVDITEEQAFLEMI
jgi:hypothetical protein